VAISSLKCSDYSSTKKDSENNMYSSKKVLKADDSSVEGTSVDSEFTSGYAIIKNDKNYFTLTINVDNPESVSIEGIIILSTDENAKIQYNNKSYGDFQTTDDENLFSTYIGWPSNNYYTANFELYAEESSVFTISKARLSNTNGENVSLSGNNVLDVFSIKDTKVDANYNADGIIYTISNDSSTSTDNTNISESFKFESFSDNTTTENLAGTEYTINESGNIETTYNLLLSSGEIISSYHTYLNILTLEDSVTSFVDIYSLPKISNNVYYNNMIINDAGISDDTLCYFITIPSGNALELNNEGGSLFSYYKYEYTPSNGYTILNNDLNYNLDNSTNVTIELSKDGNTIVSKNTIDNKLGIYIKPYGYVIAFPLERLAVDSNFDKMTISVNNNEITRVITNDMTVNTMYDKHHIELEILSTPTTNWSELFK